MKIYIAAPLFSAAEKQFNIELRNTLREWGYDTYLPQEDGGIAFNLIKTVEQAAKVRRQIFLNDVKEVKECDTILCLLDGRVPDEGLCIELGLAYASNKICIGYKTDQRALDKYGDNLMITGCLRATANSEAELKSLLGQVR